MKRILSLIVVIGACLFLAQSNLFGQRTLSGVVTDASIDEPLIGATVLEKGTQNGTITGIDGDYVINVSSDTSVLVFSYVGYQTLEIPVSGQTVINAALGPDTEALDEVVVIAYGTQKKSHLTGAIASLDAEGLDEVAVSRADQALVGKLAGVQILNTDGLAGSQPSIRIRGAASISASSDPLIVIDGYPMPEGSDAMSMVNMGDVESIEVLKDAASSALYGSRASAGVILISTKSGASKETRYNFKMYTGINKPVKLPDMMNNVEYLELLYEEGDKRMEDPAVDGDRFITQRFYDVTDNERLGYLLATNLQAEPTNWEKEALRDYGQISSYQLSASGGGEEAQFYVSGSYNSDKSIMEKSSYDKFSFRAKLDAKLSDKIKVGASFAPTYSIRERPEGDLTDYQRFHSYIPVYHNDATIAYVDALAAFRGLESPGLNVGDYAQAAHFYGASFTGIGADGNVWNETTNNAWTTGHNSPVSIRDRYSRIDNRYALSGNAYITIDILPGLKFTTTNGFYYSYNEYNEKAQSNAEGEGELNRLLREMDTDIDLLSENILSYSVSFGNHSINAIAGYTAQQEKVRINEIEGQGFNDDRIMQFDGASSILKDGTTSYYETQAMMSVLGRVIYDYKGKYLASFAMRGDGSTRFPKGHQWGAFPSGSVGWRISEEEFLSSISSVSNLKLRASYGLTGNNNIATYSYMNKLSTVYPNGEVKDYQFGSGLVSGLTPTEDALGNLELTWEKLREINIGLDLGFLRNRHTLSIEYYDANSIDLLLTQPAMDITGHKTAWNNIGEVNNKGIEIELKAGVISNTNFSWIISGNFAKNKNTLVDYGGKEFENRSGMRSEQYRAEVGEESIVYYGFETDGIWMSYDEVEAEDMGAYSVFLPAAGGLKVVDQDGNDTINFDDRTNIGSPFPDFTWAITNTFAFRGFDFSFLFQGSQGGELINGNASNFEPIRLDRAYTDNRWISPMYPGDGQTVYATNTPKAEMLLSDYVVEDASYVALRDVTIGYALPAKVAQALLINNLRAYVSVRNLFYFMGEDYRGINPEARKTNSQYNNPLVDGYQQGVFPLTRSITFGLDIAF
ncbi:SusC/RagA family TonB-linked outer membrane protein [Bacteroidota bacterium]